VRAGSSACAAARAFNSKADMRCFKRVGERVKPRLRRSNQISLCVAVMLAEAGTSTADLATSRNCSFAGRMIVGVPRLRGYQRDFVILAEPGTPTANRL